jgi:hypothetical protein
MKTKHRVLFGFAALVFAAVFFLFAGCEDDIQKIEGTVSIEKASAPSNVQALISGSYVQLQWEAASNATGYSVYWQQEGKKTIHSVTSFYSSPGGNDFNDDLWSCELYMPSRAGRIRFGVSANSPTASRASDIVWSDYL